MHISIIFKNDMVNAINVDETEIILHFWSIISWRFQSKIIEEDTKLLKSIVSDLCIIKN